MLEAKLVTIREQVIEDPMTGLTIQFEVVPDGTTRVRIYGEALEHGNRDFVFNEAGGLTGRGTAVGKSRPTFLVDVDQL